MAQQLEPTTLRRKGQPLGETGTLDKNKSRISVTINRPVEEVYSFWRNFENLARFMKDVEKIEVLEPGRSHWQVRLKNGLAADWYARVTEDSPDRYIAWESEEGSSVKTRGWVNFEPAPANRGTIVSLAMDYEIPGGKLAELVTMFMGESPEFLTQTNLKRFKAVMETGEFATTEGQPSGREEAPAHETKH